MIASEGKQRSRLRMAVHPLAKPKRPAFRVGGVVSGFEPLSYRVKAKADDFFR